jgi:rhamnulokinase
MGPAVFAAVDLGASSGRVLTGGIGSGARSGDGELRVREVSRFANEPVEAGGTLHWDILALLRGILNGLSLAAREEPALASVGIDSWGVDYGLLDATGALLGNPVHYRDHRTDDVLDRVLGKSPGQVPAAELYATTGVQLLPINTVFQLAAAAGTPALQAARTLLLIPDLIGYWLTGVARAEATNASTTGLLDIETGDWARPLMLRLGIEAGLFPPLQQPGDLIGPLLGGVAAATGLPDGLPVTAVASHDTASAVAAVPAGPVGSANEHGGGNFAYISSGTWSLVGLELDKPVLHEASREANFTNERGIDGTVRYLRNVMGLWLLQETMRAWQAAGPAPGAPDGTIDLDRLLREASRVPAFTAVVDASDPVFLPPGDMPGRIARACRDTGQRAPSSPAEYVRCILDSLALAYRQTLRAAMRLAGRDVDVVHVVGGGARNELLCQLTADACGVPVVAGPAEAAALGNILVQARAAGVLAGDLADIRRLVRRELPLRRFEPSGTSASAERAWEAAARRAGLR